MRDGMGTVQKNDEKSIRIFTLVDQLLQAFNQFTRSVGINALVL